MLQREPDWNLLPAGVPQGIKKLLRLCLEKDVKKRRSDAADVRIDIEQALSEPPEIATLPATPRTSRRRMIAISAAVFSAAVVASLLTWVALRPTAQPAQPVARLTVPLGPLPLGAVTATATAVTATATSDVAISPDGRRIVYVMGDSLATLRLYVRSLDQLDATALPGIVGARNPFISPGGNWIGFSDGASLKKVAINGGPAVTLRNIDGNPRGASWGLDDRIIFATSSPGSGLQRVPAGGGTPEVLTKPNPQKGEADHLFPEILPGDRAVLFTTIRSSGENSQIELLNLATGERKVLIQGGSNPHYAASGHIVYAVAGTLRAVSFDSDRLEVGGDPVPVADHVVMKMGGGADFTVSNDGSLAYVAGDSVTGATNTLVWVDRQGHEEPIPVPPRAYSYVRISPDGTRVALDIRDQENDIWIWDLIRRTLTRLTFEPGINRNIAWSPDGRRLAFSADREGMEHVYWQAADGTGAAERLTQGTKAESPDSFLPDGKRLLFHSQDIPRDIFIVNLDGEHRTEPLLHMPFDEMNASVSPDGRWLAYQSDESGRNEVYVRPFPDINSGRWQISVSGGTRPDWARNGRELFYLVPPGRVMAVPVQPASSFVAGNPQMVFDGPYVAPATGPTYDVSPDGKRFLMIKEVQPAGAGSTPPKVVVVLNWFEELKQKVSTGTK